MLGDLGRRALLAALAQARLDGVQGRAVVEVLLGGLELGGDLGAQLAQAVLGVADGLAERLGLDAGQVDLGARLAQQRVGLLAGLAGDLARLDARVLQLALDATA